MWDGSALFCHSTLSVYLCIWSTLLGSAVLFPSDTGHSVNTISALSVSPSPSPSLNPPHCHTEKTAPSIPLYTHFLRMTFSLHVKSFEVFVNCTLKI